MRRWVAEKPDKLKVERLRSVSHLDNFALNVLVSRGYDTPEKIDAFMRGTVHDLRDPRLMKDSQKAIEIIKHHKLKGDACCVYTDYDCDGVGGGSTAYLMLEECGVEVYHYSNNRFVEGYGICKQGIDAIMQAHPTVKLILTVDNGISAHEAILYAKEKGLTVIVTDHHEPGETLPPADAIVNPKRKDDSYPFKGLCGAGVVWKLLLILYYDLDIALEKAYDLLDIVALSTVGDLVPLVDENRIIATHGLNLIREEKRPIFRFFREVTESTEINAHFTLGFRYCPMVNALGRLDGSVEQAIEAFISNDLDVVLKAVQYMYVRNEERKELTTEQETLAMSLFDSTYGEVVPAVITLYHPSFHEGIIGLIAGRLKEHFNRPTIVFADGEGCIKGSARSINGLHIKEAFDKCSKYILGYGGHEMAGGLSVSRAHFDSFQNAILKIGEETLTEDDFIKKIPFVTTYKSSDITFDVVDALKELEPYGMGFPKPLVKLVDFKVSGVRRMGTDGQHVKFTGTDGFNVINWSGYEHFEAIGAPDTIKALGLPSINVYNNQATLQFLVDGDNLFRGA